MVKISVIIPTFNDKDDIRKCLESLREQTLEWGRDFEVIVVDGHSTDGTDMIAKEMGAKVVYESIGTRGGACNVGFKHSSGKIIVFTDADAHFPPDWLEKISRKFDETGADVVGGDDIPPEDATIFEKTLFAFDIFRGNPKTDREVVNRLRGVNTAYRREIFEKVGGFDERLASVEETEMHWRMRNSGARMIFDPEIVVYHRRRRDMKSLAKQMLRNGIGRINALKRNPRLLSLMDVMPIAGFVALLASAGLSLYLSSLIPILSIAALASLYLVIKAYLVARKAKMTGRYLEILLMTAVRETSFSAGIILGIFTARKPEKKM